MGPFPSREVLVEVPVAEGSEKETSRGVGSVRDVVVEYENSSAGGI